MFILKLKDKRLQARLRSDFPCLVPAFLLSLGEMIGFGECSSWGWGVCFILALFSIWMSRKNIALIFVGIIAALLVSPAKYEIKHEEVIIKGSVDEPPRRFAPESITLSIKVIESSAVLQDETKKDLSITGERLFCSGVYLPWKNLYGVDQEDIITFHAKLSPFPKEKEAYFRRRGYIAMCKIKHALITEKMVAPFFVRAKKHLAKIIRNVIGDGERGAIFLAASIGYRDLISKYVEDGFKKTGLAHLLVLSGYQITLLYYFLFAAFNFFYRVLPLRRRSLKFRQIPAWLALLGTAAFIGLAGIEGPSLRAGVAALVVVLSATFERSTGMLHSISVAFLILNLIWPGSFLDPGVQLTFAALCGINVAAQYQKTDSILMAYLRVCIYASAFTTPFVLYWFNYLSLIGFICNPLFAPLISVLGCKIGFIAILMHYTSVDPAGWLLLAISDALYFNSEIILYLATLPFAGFEVEGVTKYLLIIINTILICILANKAIKTYLSQYDC
ncbi:MAG: ComEC/Rec2 family competence protein [Bdellovibrionota bacterium]|jgi:ComEC/Rec2-related protein